MLLWGVIFSFTSLIYHNVESKYLLVQINPANMQLDGDRGSQSEDLTEGKNNAPQNADLIGKPRKNTAVKLRL